MKIITIPSLLITLLFSCGSDEALPISDSHSKAAPPDYARIFPVDKVNRLDIEVLASDWQVAQTDLATNFGDGGGSGGDELDTLLETVLSACEGKIAGDDCSVVWMDETFNISCRTGDLDKGELACLSDELIEQVSPPDEEVSSDTTTNPVFIPATVRFGNDVWKHVGFRFKGDSTLSGSLAIGTEKIPFKLDFDEFEESIPEVLDQRFYGFKKISFSNNLTDPSYLREKFVAESFREFGVPAPHVSFYQIYMDHGSGSQYLGMYTAVEVPGGAMFKTNFSAKGGNLYKPDRSAAGAWLAGQQEQEVETAFVKKSNKIEADWSDVKTALEALNGSQSDIEAWRVGLEKRFDVRSFIRWLAANTVLIGPDVFPGNHYLYGDPGDSNRLKWIPWDFDATMAVNLASFDPSQVETDKMHLDMSNVAVNNSNWAALIEVLMKDSVYFQLYKEEVASFASTVFEKTAYQTRLTRDHEMIAPLVVGSGGERASATLTDAEQFKNSYDELLEFVVERQQAVDVFLASP